MVCSANGPPKGTHRYVTVAAFFWLQCDALLSAEQLATIPARVFGDPQPPMLPMVVLNVLSPTPVAHPPASLTSMPEPAAAAVIGSASSVGSNSATANEDTWSCSICLSLIKSGERVRLLACNHLFHSGCIATWSVWLCETIIGSVVQVGRPKSVSAVPHTVEGIVIGNTSGRSPTWANQWLSCLPIGCCKSLCFESLFAGCYKRHVTGLGVHKLAVRAPH